MNAKNYFDNSSSKFEQWTDFEMLKRKFPASEQFYEIDNMVSLFSGDAKAKRRSTKVFLDGVCSFKNLIAHYGLREPALKNAFSSFDETARNFISIIRHGQFLYSRIGQSYPHPDQLGNIMLNGFAESLHELLSEFCVRSSLPVEQVIERLKQTKLDKLPSLAVLLTMTLEYLKKHKGTLENGRPPAESDLRDLCHAGHIPYRDIFLTDRFFSVIGRKGAKIYKTEVLRSLAQLKSVLKS